MVTIITKLYKKKGRIYYSKATRNVDLLKDIDSGLSMYPIAHMVWEEKEGSSRGVGEVEPLISCQIEVNKTLTRRLLVSKNIAYPQKVANVSKIENPDAIDTVGGTIRVTDDKSIEDVRKIFSITQPMPMSSDVEKLQQELIDMSRQLANASDAATGDIDPESASGRAILAVQQAQNAPLTEQKDSLKSMLEDIALIWYEMIVAYNQKGISLEQEVLDGRTGEKTVQLVKVPASVLKELIVSVKIDITPKTAFDKLAQELTLENLLKGGWFSPQLIGQLEIYIEALPDDASMPKQIVKEIIKKEKEKQQRIAQMQAQAQMMMQRANTFLNQDVDAQAQQVVDAIQPVQQSYQH